MYELLYNPWVIGIGGGILSGFIVTFISRALLSRRDRREYIQKAISANRDIIYAVRPGISEGLIPNIDIVKALTRATARKYGVDSKDLYGSSEIGQELIKEVMDSSFISSKTKKEYCEELTSLISSEPRQVAVLNEIGSEKILESSSGLEDYRSRMITKMSMMMGLLVTMMTVIFAFITKLSGETSAISKENLVFRTLIPMLISVLTIMVAIPFTTIALKMKKDRDEKDKSTKDIDPYKKQERE